MQIYAYYNTHTQYMHAHMHACMYTHEPVLYTPCMYARMHAYNYKAVAGKLALASVKKEMWSQQWE